MPGNTGASQTHAARRGLRLLLSLLLLGTAIGVSLTAPQPAQAAADTNSATATTSVQPMSSIANCPANDLCWWVDANQVGVMHPVRDAIYDWSTQKEPTCNRADPLNATWNDCASTLYNKRSGYGAQVYANSYPKGGSPSSTNPGFCLQPGSRVALDLTQVRYSNEVSMTLNDSISSNRWRSGGC